MTRAQQIATTILNQLGGHRFLAMTGAKQLISLESGLQFSLPARFARKGINKVQVVLTGMDDYHLKFFRYNSKSFDCPCLEEREGIYCDQLQDVFTAVTGLYTHL